MTTKPLYPDSDFQWMRTGISADVVCGDNGYDATLSLLVTATVNVQLMLGAPINWVKRDNTIGWSP